MLRTAAALLLSAGTAFAAPVGQYEPQLPCYGDGEGFRVEANRIVYWTDYACEVTGWQQRRDGWFAFLKNCEQSVDTPTDYGFEAVGDWGLTITPLSDGKYLFDVNLGKGWFWTGFKCEGG